MEKFDDDEILARI